MRQQLLLTAIIAIFQVDQSLAFASSRPLQPGFTKQLVGSQACAEAAGLTPLACNHNRHSSKDWMHNLASLPKSTVLREIANPILSVTLWATFLSLAHYKMASSPSLVLQRLAGHMCVSGEAHKFLGPSLSLLLVFRTNSAYQRFVVSQINFPVYSENEF